MNAEEARKIAFEVNEQQRKVYEEYAANQFQRLTKLISESAEAGNYCIRLQYEQVQPTVEKWLLENGYKIENHSYGDNYHFIITW